MFRNYAIREKGLFPFNRPTAAWIGILVGITIAGIGDAGIGRTGLVRGNIDRFGSIFVNDRDVDTDGAVFLVDGRPGIQADLRVGQIVSIRGVYDSELPLGVADEVVFEDNVDGPVASINPDDDEIVALGQTVILTETTVVELLSGSSDIEDLGIDDRIEVSGFPLTDGRIIASRVEQKPAGAEFEVTGMVAFLDGNRFSINELQVDASSAIRIGFPPPGPVNGDVLEVKGSSFDSLGRLEAASIELRPPLAAAADEYGEFEGPITDFVNPDRFSLADIRVTTDELTEYVGGGPANLSFATDVEVSGVFDESGTLVAERVEIRGTRIRVIGFVVDASGTAMTVLGIAAIIDTNAEMVDDSAANEESFEPDDVRSGDFIEARSYLNPSATTPFLAGRVKRIDPEDDLRLQGFVSAEGQAGFAVLGAPVSVGADTDYIDAHGLEMSAAEFFAAATVGTFVVIHSDSAAASGVFADQIELMLDD